LRQSGLGRVGFALALTFALAAVTAPAAAGHSSLAVSIVGEGTVTSDPSGIACDGAWSPSTGSTNSGTCSVASIGSHPAPGFHIATITADPGGGWTFAGWSQDCSGTDAGCTLSMTAPRTARATFTDITAPTSVALTSPSTTATRVGGTVPLTVEGCDSGSGLDKAEFWVKRSTDAVYQLVGTDTTASGFTALCSVDPLTFSINWNSLVLFPSNGGSTADDGVANIQVKVFDHFDNVTTVTRTITIDNTPPGVDITGGPPEGSTTRAQEESFTFTVSESGTTMQCRLDAAAFSGCNTATTHFVSGLSDGPHTFQVRSTDPAGHATTVSRSWTVDRTPPETTIVVGPADGSVTSSTTATFGFAASEAGSTFKCRLGTSGPFGTCSGPGNFHTVSVPGSGAYTVQIVATDAVGNEDPTPAARSWTVDATAPDTTIMSGPSGTVAVATATFAFASSEAGSTFACSLDGGPFSPCSSPQSYAGLSPGSHIFQVRATDAVGNTDPSPATQAWTYSPPAPRDTAAPQTTITGGPRGTTRAKRATFRFVASEAGSTFQCKLDRGPWRPCRSPKTYRNLRRGWHTFQVRATDAARNVDATPAKRRWRIR
jgi:uncharacterized repeat protein (TIGR02543 family)